jgi:pimeloyl-ACP methyl ester carboxylesterase
MPTYTGADDAALHYDDLRHGASETTPIVVLAGGAARHPVYLGDLAGLGERRRLVVPHLRGVGSSPLPGNPGDASFWRQAGDVEKLRVHLGLETIALLGHSAGTRLAVSYAAQYPDRVAAMVLVTPPAAYLVDVPPDQEAMIDVRRGDPDFDAAIALRHDGQSITDDEAFNEWQQRMAPTAYATWGTQERAHAASGRYSLTAARAYFSATPPADLPARLRGVEAPVLIVAGADDCVTGFAPVMAMGKLFPAGRIAVIERCGHYPWVEQPVAFRHAVDEFLDSHVGPAGD